MGSFFGKIYYFLSRDSDRRQDNLRSGGAIDKYPEYRGIQLVRYIMGVMGTLCWPKGRGGPSVPVPVQHLLTRQCGDDKQLDDDYDERRKETGNGQTTAAISACIDSCL